MSLRAAWPRRIKPRTTRASGKAASALAETSDSACFMRALARCERRYAYDLDVLASRATGEEAEKGEESCSESP